MKNSWGSKSSLRRVWKFKLSWKN